MKKEGEISIIKPSEYGLEPTEANKIVKNLMVVQEERQGLIDTFESIIDQDVTKENAKEFKELRLLFVKNRTQGLIKWHKANKEFFLAGGRFVDAIKNRELAIIEPIEARLKAKEDHFKNLELERIAKVQEEREKELEKYEVENVEALHLGSMSVEIWTNFMSGTKAAYEKKLADEKAAEEKRIAEEEMEKLYNDRISEILPYSNFRQVEDKRPDLREATNEEFDTYLGILKDRHKKDLEDRKKQAKENERLRKKAEAQEKEKEEAKKIADKKLAVEKESREKAEKELADKKAEEDRKKEEERAKIEAELKKEDVDKIKDLCDDLEALKTKYSFKSAKYKSKYKNVGGLIDKVTKYINE